MIKKNIKLIIGILIGIIISGSIVYAVNVTSSSVEYTRSGSSVTSVEGALNELYDKAKGKNNIVYYEYGDPTTSSTTDYTTLDKSKFIALNGVQKSVCIIRNNVLHCFDYNNYEIEKVHMQFVFSDISCVDDEWENYHCRASDFHCYADVNGSVGCDSGGHGCRVHSTYGTACN